MPSGWTRLRPRELRVPVRARLSARPRRRQPAREVRRARLQRRRAAAPAAAAAVAAAARDAAGARRTGAGQRAPGGGWWPRRAGGRARPVAAGAPASRRSRFPRSSRAGRVRCRRRRSRRSSSSSQEGGTVIAIGGAAMGAVQQFELPLTNHLIENGSAAAAREVLRARLGAARGGRRTNPLAHGLGKELDVFFDNNPVFKLGAGRRGEGSAPRRVVRRRGAAAQRLGLGPEVSRQGHRNGRDAASARAGCSCLAPSSCSARSRTAPTSSSSTGCTCRSRRR